MQLLNTLTALLSLPVLALAQSSISAPANGTKVAPGASFPFSYNIDADYCKSSYGFNVYIFTKKPTSFKPSQTWATGAYLGRYSEENYPGNPSPTNTPPSTFTMPDFSQSPGGFGTGKQASNLPVYLVVMEDKSQCQATVGVRFALEYVTLIYNATK